MDDARVDTEGLFCPKCGLGSLRYKSKRRNGTIRLKCANGHNCTEHTASTTPATRQPKILLVDIEVAPTLAYIWQLFQRYIAHDQIYRDWHMITWAARWLGDSETMYDSMHLHEDYKPWSEDDKTITKSLYELMEEADWVIGHNIVGFDAPKMNSRFIEHELPPPSPYKPIDTLKIAKYNFSFTSNKLDYLGEKLCGIKKIKTDHELWRRCLAGERLAWDEMLRYNIRDIDVLEAVYFKVRAWDRRHPNFMLYTNSDVTLCGVCGSHKMQETRKTVKTNVSEFVGIKCLDCGHQSRLRKNIRLSESKGGPCITMNAQ